ncbi:MAG: FG-GAP repeat protein [Planctomycetota bacterium]
MDPNNWDQQAKLIASDGASNDEFGWSVSISGDYAIVGARYDDDNGSNSGSAYIFKRAGTTWIEIDKLTAFDGYDSDEFGCSVSNNTNYYALVGARNDDDNGSNSGSAYMFERVCPTADLTDDCTVNFKDLSIIADQWLQEN